ncbi:MAG: hypothetical protein EBR59_00710 [Methylococcaceae bacterium]|nr:hypothetical protein [Methylococcaceae bacterium]
MAKVGIFFGTDTGNTRKIGMLYDAFADAGAKFIGFTSTDGYTYDRSKAELDGQFVGLVLDEDNQKDQTEGRLSAWLADIAPAWQ